ncbi:hypothetical protein MJO28_001983 [Puccinia striiformis f. sp. tritici]|uniref:Uncharacterized protein n=1 Tax=Puccinia striiformis f. sp. tritici TaxID=168172 RepID=A0ACC0EWR5_9BASI|nr:hypothetical protein MJO28_001983 [Puccinia striiformis f. sp. tritici]
MLKMMYWLLLLLLTGSSLEFDSIPDRTRPSPALADRDGGGDESLPSFHPISIEPGLSTGSPTTLSRSADWAHFPATGNHNSNEPGGAIELQALGIERAKEMDEKTRRRPSRGSFEGSSSTRLIDKESQSTMGTCAICLDEFDIAALEDEKSVPDQAPLRRLIACSHTYHRKCIDTWLADRTKTCPHCRTRSKDDGIARIRRNPVLNLYQDVHTEITHYHQRHRTACSFYIIMPLLSTIFIFILTIGLWLYTTPFPDWEDFAYSVGKI